MSARSARKHPPKKRPKARRHVVAAPVPRPAEVRTRVRVIFGDGWRARHGRMQTACAWSDAEAVRLMAEKLGYTPGFDVVRLGPAKDGNGEIWEIVEVQRT